MIKGRLYGQMKLKLIILSQISSIFISNSQIQPSPSIPLIE